LGDFNETSGYYLCPSTLPSVVEKDPPKKYAIFDRPLNLEIDLSETKIINY
jgi:hypothetical protein